MKKNMLCGVAALAALLSHSAPAQASLIEYTLDNVTSVGNPAGTVTGFFDFDTSLNSVTSFSITSQFGVGSPFNVMLNPSNSTATFAYHAGFPEIFMAGSLYLDISGTPQPTIGPEPLQSGAISASYPFGVLQLQGSVTGTPLSTVPLPAALPLFSSAVVGLMGFARHRKFRNNQPAA
jgi:hypothetical protein